LVCYALLLRTDGSADSLQHDLVYPDGHTFNKIKDGTEEIRPQGWQKAEAEIGQTKVIQQYYMRYMLKMTPINPFQLRTISAALYRHGVDVELRDNLLLSAEYEVGGQGISSSRLPKLVSGNYHICGFYSETQYSKTIKDTVSNFTFGKILSQQDM